MTQSTLSMGICSIPHLSKIENNSKEANKETIRLLLERLAISLQNVEDSSRNIRHVLAEFLAHIQYCEEEKVTEAFLQLEYYQEIVLFTDYIYLNELYKLRYYLFIKDIAKAEKQLKWLQFQKQNFSQHEKYLLSYFSALILVLRGRYEEADELLSNVVQEHIGLGSFEGEIYYHLAVVKGYLDQSSQAILYGKKALQFFKEQYNFKRIIYALMSLAINYSRSKVYNEALETYNYLLRITEMFPHGNLLPQIYHNIGDLHHNMGNYSIALAYFKKSSTIMPKNNENYLLCLYNVSQTEFRLEQWSESKESFELLKEEALKMKALHYRLYAIFYLLLLNDQKEKAMLFLEKKIMPFTSKRGELKEAHHHFSNILADYYKQEGEFEKAVQFIM
ncbi:tetratricopeptide repeat protein [Psychrobacillus glaciei]|uniref:Tetratricopeptide repeat protein n=2 Tax=Psychrobacillus glaciei TaxID=2283160 RepID=A0A5J6SU43_9BACI|nr:tetratricopeptide repeat protein [Psychrobacillus glaciei]